MIRHWIARTVMAALALSAVACASNPAPPPVVTTPKYPEYPALDIPPALRIAADIRTRHDVAWRRLQSGDLRGAGRDFTDILQQAPGFYPANAGLGYVSLADRQFKTAVSRFDAALTMNDRYLPALIGQVDAELALSNEDEAIRLMERILVVDPRRDGIRSRLELVRFRQLQALIEEGRRARVAGRFATAEDALTRALRAAPSSAIILRELSLVHAAKGDWQTAELYARQVLGLEPNDAEAHAALAAILESRQRYRDASTEYGRAAALDPRDEWRDKATALRTKADLEALPGEFASLPTAATITRAQVAAYVGIKLESLVARAPRRGSAVATDVRNHWAAPWILRLTQAGLMEVYPNHTFQPAATVRRSDLAQVVSELLAVAALPDDLTRWRAARPRFSDLVTTHVSYRAAALAVTAGAMRADETNRFQATAPATGADLAAAVARIEQLAKK